MSIVCFQAMTVSQGNEDNSATVTLAIRDVLLNPEMTISVTSRELLTESILQKSRQLKGDLLEITKETAADLPNKKDL